MEKKNNIRIFSKRITAYLLDILFVFLVISLISEIRFINPYYDKYIDSYESYTELIDDYTNEEISIDEYNELYEENYYFVSKYGVSYNIVIIVVIILYFGIFQKYNNGQTLGKKIMKIRVVDNNNEKIGLGKSLLRILPMYYIYVGGVIPLVINTILVFILNENNYMTITTIISYIFLIISIISFIMVCIKKEEKGLHDIFSKTKVIYDGK